MPARDEMSLRLLNEGLLSIKVEKVKTFSRSSWNTLKRKWVRLYVTRPGDPELRFLLEVFPAKPPLWRDGKRSESPASLAKHYSFTNITSIRRSILIPYGAVITVNGTNLDIVLAGTSHAEMEEWLDFVRNAQFGSPHNYRISNEAILVSILDSKDSEKLSLGNRYWVEMKELSHSIEFLTASPRAPIMPFRIFRDRIHKSSLVETKSEHDANRIIEIEFFLPSKGKKPVKLWLYSKEGLLLYIAIQQFLSRSDPLMPIRQKAKSIGETVQKPGKMRIQDGPQTRTFKRNTKSTGAPGADRRQSNVSNTSSNGSLLNSFLRKSLPSLLEIGSFSGHKVLSGSATGSSGSHSPKRHSPPPLPSKEELEKRENDRLFEQQMIRRWSRQGSQSSPTTESSNAAALLDRSIEKAPVVSESTGYRLPSNISVASRPEGHYKVPLMSVTSKSYVNLKPPIPARPKTLAVQAAASNTENSGKSPASTPKTVGGSSLSSSPSNSPEDKPGHYDKPPMAVIAPPLRTVRATPLVIGKQPSSSSSGCRPAVMGQNAFENSVYKIMPTLNSNGIKCSSYETHV